MNKYTEEQAKFLVEVAVKEFVKRYEAAGYSIPVPTIRIRRLERRGWAGQAFPSFGIIELDIDYFNAHTEEMCAVTVPHELAHLIVHKYYPCAKQAHGPEFRTVAQSIGACASTYHSMTRPESKKANAVKRHEVKCPCQSHWFTTNRLNELNSGKVRYTCKTCGAPVVDAHNTVVTNDPNKLNKQGN